MAASNPCPLLLQPLLLLLMLLSTIYEATCMQEHLPGDSSFVRAGMRRAACSPCSSAVTLTASGDLRVEAVEGAYSSGSGMRRPHPRLTLVWAKYWSTYESTGWDKLEVEAIPDVDLPIRLKARATGFVEAFYTWRDIYTYWNNFRMNEFEDGNPTEELLGWMDEQYRWVEKNRLDGSSGKITAKGYGAPAPTLKQQDYKVMSSSRERRAESESTGMSSRKKRKKDRFWEAMDIVMATFDGFVDGYWASCDDPNRNMTLQELYLLQSVGDFYDLSVLFPQKLKGTNVGSPVVPPERMGDGGGEAGHQHRHYTAGHGVLGGYGYGELLECSALIKLGGTSPVEGISWSAGHTTWRPYYAMLRTWKLYNVPWVETGLLSVSSSPGLLMYSKDDWYTTDRFVIMETTNGIYNKSMYDMITHKSALMWQRVQVANMLATSGKEWTEMFEIHNSGTYNNQWMVLDVDKLEKGESQDVLWVLEQVPGLVEKADVSSQLYANGFWASYNVPYFPIIYNISGYPADEDEHSTCPRAKIFERDQGGVESVDDLKKLLRYNRYNQGDILSEGLPNNSIAARYDLLPVNQSVHWTRKAFGAVDGKVVDGQLFRDGSTLAICGPTSDHQEAFSWSSSGLDSNGSSDVDPTFHDGGELKLGQIQGEQITHDGLVDVFDFKWELHQRSFAPWG